MNKPEYPPTRTTRQSELDADNPFVQYPDALLAALTPEQYRERQALYQSAYEKAVRQVARPKAFVPPFEFEMEEGLGI